MSDPLPTDPQGQRLCEIFGSYLYCSIYADAPQDVTEKPKWRTQKRYKLKSRVLYRDWQDAQKLIGVRPGHHIVYALLDIDINSPYHPRQDVGAIARIEAALETIGITRTLRIRSSWSEGIHLYLPLPEPVKTFDLAVALKNCLLPQGFQLKQGHLECFPNVKAYGNIIKTEYLAHRLPLQPASGSCLLDKAFNPAGDQLGDFLEQWDIAAAGQDVSTLKQALPLARKNRVKKVRNRLNKVESWKQDLETVMAEGWSGPGQTNQLLKEFGCYGHVFLGHAGEALVDFIYQQAVSSPGYEKWCRHQREIWMRSRVWATAIEKYYWPLGSYSKGKTANSQPTVNTLRAQSAQESIRAAVQQLESANELPQQATARATAIRNAQAALQSTSSSLETLYKDENKKLWHPDFYIQEQNIQEQSIKEQKKLSVSPSSLGLASEPAIDERPCLEKLRRSENGKLRTKQAIMKCVSHEHEGLSSFQKNFNSERGVRGKFLRFPQSKPAPKRKQARADNTVQKHRTPAEEKGISLGISQRVADIIATTQDVVQKLNWSFEQIQAFIAQKFQGRRRAQLSDDETLALLYYLQIQYLEASQ
ncbi:MAG: hypothetical protein WA885_10995 [Phormidesmis sp.]